MELECTSPCWNTNLRYCVSRFNTRTCRSGESLSTNIPSLTSPGDNEGGGEEEILRVEICVEVLAMQEEESVLVERNKLSRRDG